jgi:hypothetical protein
MRRRSWCSLIRKAFTRFVSLPLWGIARRLTRRFVATCAVILAAALVTSVTVDLGPALKGQAETRGSRLLQRPMHIGRLGVWLWGGQFQLDDFVIEGLTPDSPPFFQVKRMRIGMPWSTLFNRRIVLSSIELDDWTMHVEMMPDGRNSFIKLPERQGGRSPWTTTLQYVRARNGETTYKDYGTPWSVVTRNLDIQVARTSDQYVGRAAFRRGTVAIQSYVPFDLDMASRFTIQDGRLVFERIDLTTEGTKTRLLGDASLSHWPEQMYRMHSTISFPWMRKVFYANETFQLSGDGTFDGTFHLFRDVGPNGRSRVGRELKGTFNSPLAGLNTLRFSNLTGSVRWVPESVEVTDTTTGFYGGRMRLGFAMGPLGLPDVQASYRFTTDYENVDLTAFTNYLQTEGLRLAGRASGRNLLEWPRGRWKDRTGEGHMRVSAPDGATPMAEQLPLQAIAARLAQPASDEPFSNHTPRGPVPIAGDVSYGIEPSWVNLGPSRLATPDTHIAFEGRTAYGDASRIPFRVVSADWQESDRLLAGIMTAFGARTNAIPIGGYGTFEGVMLNAFQRPRIEGRFAGERMRAWDVEWGSASGDAVIENGYVDVKDVTIASGESAMQFEGRFSAGFPRRDGGEELNARIRIVRRPVKDLRHAFGIDDYDLSGHLSGEFRVFGRYQQPLGFGNLSLTSGVAYGESFDTALAAVQFEADGVRLENLQVTKSGGRATGAAFVGWKAGSYSFNLTARDIPVESVALARSQRMPLSGLLDFSAGGSGTFDAPRYDVKGTVRDLFAGDEGIGQVGGEIGVNDDVVTLKLEAASSRLAVSGSGRITLTQGRDADILFRVTDTSLDPYLRPLLPRLSPYTTAVASGTIRVVGQLTDVDNLVVDTTVDALDVRLFDYQLRNAAPLRLSLDRHTVRLVDVRLAGEDTALELSGTANLHDDRLAIRMKGNANLGILQGFVANVRSSGRATLEAAVEGTLDQPLLTGAMTAQGGRIRHFGLPHALENMLGPIRFDSRSIRFDDLNARLGGGPVQFGGSIGIEGYRLGQIDLTMKGQQMRLRFPEGMSSLADADLTLRGTTAGAVLAGQVTVLDAVYAAPINMGGNLLNFGGGAPANGGGTPVGQAPPLPLRYEVDIAAPSTLQVRNNSMRVAARAALQLRGTYDRPLILGRADVERGQVTFEGRRYTVTRGSIDLNNPTKLDPFFDLETETRVRVPGDTYRVTMQLSGTLTGLNFTFASDPWLPQVEILALLFSDSAPGRNIELRQYNTNITPQQQLLREQAARLLTRQISSEVEQVVSKTFGVDTFQVTPSLADPNQQSSRLDPGGRVTIGKWLSEQLYLSYSRSLSSTTQNQILLLEFDQTQRFSWVFSRNEDATYALDLRMRTSF